MAFNTSTLARLDDFIFQRGNPESAKLSRFNPLRDVDPAYRSRSVHSSLEPKGKILEVLLKGPAAGKNLDTGLCADHCGNQRRPATQRDRYFDG